MRADAGAFEKANLIAQDRPGGLLEEQYIELGHRRTDHRCSPT
jgi:hypothetical protein